MPAIALRKLLQLHLQVAHRLRLLEVASPTELQDFAAQDADWSDTKMTPVNRFERAVEAAQSHFAHNWRFRCCQLGQEVVLSRVVQLADLHFTLDAVTPRTDREMASVISDFKLLKGQFDRPFAEAGPSGLDAGIRNTMSRLRALVVGRRLRPFLVTLNGSGRRACCWVAQPGSARATTTAQDLRDRLGLHHYPQGESAGDQLVRLQFRMTLSSSPFPSAFDPVRVEQDPPGLWLLRPTVVDKPNVRFSQACESDAIDGAWPSGATIDIGLDDYPEGEAELILRADKDATVQWHDVELLPGGVPVRHARDNDHPHFSATMHTRLQRFE